MADMDSHHTTVTAELAAKSSATTTKNACWESRSEDIPSEASRPPLASMTLTASLAACRIRRGGATRAPFRCVPGKRDRATDTCPRDRPDHANRWNTCDKRDRPPARTNSDLAYRA